MHHRIPSLIFPACVFPVSLARKAAGRERVARPKNVMLKVHLSFRERENAVKRRGRAQIIVRAVIFRFYRRANLRAPLLLLSLNQPQVNCLYSCIGPEVLLDSPKNPAFPGDGTGRVIDCFLLEIEICDLVQREFPVAGTRAIQFFKAFFRFLHELQAIQSGILWVSRLGRFAILLSPRIAPGEPDVR
jgi:hypothetical protein